MDEKQKNALKAYSLVSSFLFSILIIIGIGFGVGYFLDELFNTVFIFKVLLSLFGIFSGIIYLIVRVNKLEDK
jgi:F0F1-type ATP synthase assembly protein I